MSKKRFLHFVWSQMSFLGIAHCGKLLDYFPALEITSELISPSQSRNRCSFSLTAAGYQNISDEFYFSLQCVNIFLDTTCYLISRGAPSPSYNRVVLSRNYRLRVVPWKFDVLNIFREARENMLVLRTSNFQGATIRPIVPRHKHSIVLIVHH